MAALERQTVARTAWLDPAKFQLAFALSRLTPGTNLLAFCTALGWQMRGVAGAVVALAGASFPCSVVAVALTVLLETWQQNRWAMVAIAGASAAAIGIVAASCWQLISPHVTKGTRLRTALLVSGALIPMPLTF